MPLDHIVKDPSTRAEIEALIVEHSWMLDNHESGGLGALYTEDGRLTGIGPDRIGREAIAAYGRERATMTGRRARHVNTNMRMLKDGPDRVLCLCTITLFRCDGDAMGSADPVALADAEDVLVLGGDGCWRFQERHLVLTFESEAHRS
jgi:hypothetical protein